MTSPPPGNARIVERGFQRYDGPRSGVGGAIRSLAWQSMRAALGLGRLARYKIFPFAAVFIAYVPAIVFVGLAVVIPEGILDPNEIASYAGWYFFITLAIILFAAFVGPQMFVTDRRNGMLAMYLSTPLNRRTYLTAKSIAVMMTLGLVTLGPPLLLLLGYTAEGVGPDGVTAWFSVFGRMVLSAIAVSSPLAAISMAGSSLTDRPAFAAIGVALLLILAIPFAGVLVDAADWPISTYVISPVSMAFTLVFRIYGESEDAPLVDVPTAAVLGSCIAWTVGGLAVVAWRYSRLVIAR